MAFSMPCIVVSKRLCKMGDRCDSIFFQWNKSLQNDLETTLLGMESCYYCILRAANE